MSHMMKAIQGLDQREQLVLTLYYYEKLTFKEIGQVLELTESRVCQLHARAITVLRTTLKPQELPAAALKIERTYQPRATQTVYDRRV